MKNKKQALTLEAIIQEGRDKTSKALVHALVEASTDCALAGVQDGGKHVDVVFSRRKGKRSQIMSLEEAEERVDVAIKAIWKALTGNEISGDPVEFINS